jgi:hypothetical protein
MTLTALDEEEAPTMTVRLDLPPVGVVRGPIPQPEGGSENVLSLRRTEPAVSCDDLKPEEGRKTHYTLLDRQIGIPAEEFTVGIVKQLGFAKMERIAPRSGRLEDRTKQPDEVDELVNQFPGVTLPGSSEVTVTANKWEAAIESSTFAVSPDTWRSIVLADRHSSFVSHSGTNGHAPNESWYAYTVGSVVDSINSHEQSREVPQNADATESGS